MLVFLSGCRTNTVYVRDGDPVRLREDIKRAEVWVLDDKGDWIEGRITLPEGWYALPDPGEIP